MTYKPRNPNGRNKPQSARTTLYGLAPRPGTRRPNPTGASRP